MQGSKQIDSTTTTTSFGGFRKFNPVVYNSNSNKQNTTARDEEEDMYQQQQQDVDQYQMENESNNNFNDDYDDEDDNDEEDDDQQYNSNNQNNTGPSNSRYNSSRNGGQISVNNIKQEMIELSGYGGTMNVGDGENYSLKPALTLQQQQQQLLANAARSSKGELTCVVCGAPANGYNFDAITCESCKAFFRRNAFKQLNQFRCTNPNSNNTPCVITIVTRKKCKKCRIIKCFNMGMRKDWIMTDHEREEKKRKIEENRRRKGGPVGAGMNGQDDNSNMSSSEMANLNGSFYDDMNDGSCGGGGGGGVGVDGSPTSGGAKPIRRRRRRRRHSLLESNNNNSNNNPYPTSSGTNKSVNLVNDSLLNLEHTGLLVNNVGKKMKPLSNNNNNNSNNNTSSSSFGTYSSPLNSSLNDSFNNNNHHLVTSTTNSNNKNSSGSSCDSSPNKSSNLSSLSSSLSNGNNNNNSTNGPPSVTSLIANFGHSSGIFKQMNDCSVRLLGEATKQQTKSRMSDLQKSQINAIKEAYKQAIRLVKAQGTPRHPDDINTTINVTELAVRRIIFYFKLISDFRNLDHDLMVKLLKHNMMSLLQVHGVNSYNRINKTFQEPGTDDTPFAADSLRDVYGAQIYELIMTINENLHATSNGDMTHVKLIMLIVVFDPSNPNLSESERVRVSELLDKYVGLLHAYMNDKFGPDRTQYLFKEIVFEVNRIGDLSAWFERTVAENSNYDYIRPLMKEVFSFSAASCGSTANSYQNSAENTPPSSINSNASSVMSVHHHNNNNSSSVHSQQQQQLHSLSETFNNQ